MENCFKILSRSIVSDEARYRGVYRSLPSYVESAGAESDVNRAFVGLCEKGGQTGCLDDLNDAKTIVAAYAKPPSPQHFDIVQITSADDRRALGGEFLGFDVAVAGTGFSLLSWNLKLSPLASKDESIRKIKPLIELTEGHFSQKLNKNGLFDSLDNARFFLSCMATLQSLRPNLWESYDMNSYEIVSVTLMNGVGSPTTQ